MSPFFYILLLQKYSHSYIYIAKVQLFIELSSSFMDKFDGWAYFLFIIELLYVVRIWAESLKALETVRPESLVISKI